MAKSGANAAEIVVVGAGAAGCTLACLLARAGRDVLLVERARVADKDKLCGGVVTGQGQRLLAELHGEETLDTLGAGRIDAMRVLYRGCETTLPMRFRALPRARLDAFLLRRATDAGARLMERTAAAAVNEDAHVITLKDAAARESLPVRYGTLVAADGANSTLRGMAAGRRPRTVISYEARVEAPENGACIVQRVYPDVAGGCWLIPQGPGSAIAGCLFFPATSREPVGDARERVRAFAAELGLPLRGLRGAPVPTGEDILLRSPGGTYFLGDAAGLVEPALGAGIHLALLSAQALAKGIAGGQPYEDAMASTAARLRRDAEDVALTYLRLGFAALAANSRA